MKKVYKCLAVGAILFFVSACQKSYLEPDLDGTWEEINNTTAQLPTGCDMQISTANSDISICGINMVHPYNTNALFVQSRSRLFAKNGQIWYKERVMSFLWAIPIYTKEVYFIDYDFEGNFLWIIGENSSVKTAVIGKGRVFRKK